VRQGTASGTGANNDDIVAFHAGIFYVIALNDGANVAGLISNGCYGCNRPENSFGVKVSHGDSVKNSYFKCLLSFLLVHWVSPFDYPQLELFYFYGTFKSLNHCPFRMSQ